MSFSEGTGTEGTGNNGTGGGRIGINEEEVADIAKWWEFWYLFESPKLKSFCKLSVKFFFQKIFLAYCIMVFGKLARYVVQCEDPSNEAICPNGANFNDFYLVSDMMYSGHLESRSLFAVDMIGWQPLGWMIGIYIFRWILNAVTFGLYLRFESLFYFWRYCRYYKMAINDGKKKSLGIPEPQTSTNNEQRTPARKRPLVPTNQRQANQRNRKQVDLQKTIPSADPPRRPKVNSEVS